jgi:hypothetical protein
VFGAGVLALLLFFIGYKMMYMQGKILGGLALLGLMIMGACGLISVILFAKAQEAGEAARRRIQPQNAAALATPTKELLTEGHLEPVPSVTDRTTDLLYAEKKDAHR